MWETEEIRKYLGWSDADQFKQYAPENILDY